MKLNPVKTKHIWISIVTVGLVVGIGAYVRASIKFERNGTPVGYWAKNFASSEGKEESARALSGAAYFLVSRGRHDKNIDLVDLQLEMRTGQALGKFAIVPLDHCYGPDVRSGVPSVKCDLPGDMGTVYIGGNADVRDTLLQVRSSSMAWGVAKILGMHVFSPMFYIES